MNCQNILSSDLQQIRKFNTWTVVGIRLSRMELKQNTRPTFRFIMFFAKPTSLTPGVPGAIECGKQTHQLHATDLTRFNKIAIQGTPQMAVD